VTKTCPEGKRLFPHVSNIWGSWVVKGTWLRPVTVDKRWSIRQEGATKSQQSPILPGGEELNGSDAMRKLVKNCKKLPLVKMRRWNAWT